MGWEIRQAVVLIHEFHVCSKIARVDKSPDQRPFSGTLKPKLVEALAYSSYRMHIVQFNEMLLEVSIINDRLN